ncbi:hypothetical protein FOCC_FOCC011940 [Frankliniella occidentalis]|nr:hypothetical protein FOCC_FOCC011940 [Frankliniella occidentalis]
MAFATDVAVLVLTKVLWVFAVLVHLCAWELNCIDRQVLFVKRFYCSIYHSRARHVANHHAEVILKWDWISFSNLANAR